MSGVDLIAHACMMAEEFGIPVFPVKVDEDPEHPGKTRKLPLVKGWQNGGAVTHPEAIENLFKSAPRATHVGLVTGQRSRILVVDLDGEPGLRWWRENPELLPPTRTQRTQREGGRHLYYRLPVGCELRNSAGKFADGVDIRADGGFVVDWSSDYPPEVEEMTDAPPALIEFLKGGGAKERPAPPSGPGVPEGQRNDTLARLAGGLRRNGLDAEELEAALQVANERRCNPPLPRPEVAAIAKSVARYEPPKKAGEPAMPRRAPLDWAALDGRDPPAREWIVPDWIPHGHTTLLPGRGGIGKTLIAQHIGTALAVGADYLGPAAARRVLMWAGEDDERELWFRQRNICSYFGVPLSALAGNFILHSYVGQDITLASPTFGQLAATHMLAELKEQVNDYNAEFVILDNVARLFGGNENDRHAVTTFIAWVQGACAPAAVLLLGHPAKAQGSEFSGSTAWEGAVRARLYMSDRPPDANVDGDAPTDDRVRYLARRKANYSDLDLRRFTMNNGVLVPEAFDSEKVATPSGEFARDVVRNAVRRLDALGFHGNASTRSPEYLPKLAKQYGFLDRLAEKQFGGVMRDLIKDGELIVATIGRYSNRSPKSGLKLK